MKKISWSSLMFATADEMNELFKGDFKAVRGANKDNLFDSREELKIYRDINIKLSTLTPGCLHDTFVDMGSLLNDSSPMVELDVEIKQFQERKELLAKSLRETADALAANVYKLRCLEAAKQYREWEPVEFYREWTTGVTNPAGYRNPIWTISNAVYHATISIDENRYQKKPWEVNYDICLQQVLPGKCRDSRIVIIDRETRFQTEEEALAYLKGRKAALFKKYFSEDYPPVPAEYVNAFMWAGKMLPGYKEEQK
jgi:hypothetical protein